MNYSDPTLREHLAAEYALGTLSGRARRRFERLMAEDAALRAAVAAWEARLNPLAETLEPPPPPPRVWEGIERALGPRPAGTPAPRRSWRETLFGRPRQPVPSLATAGLWYCVGFWRAVGLGAAALAAVLAVYLAVGRGPAPFVASHVAVLTSAETGPMLVARLDAASGRLTVIPVALPPAGPDQALELWLLPPDAAGPRSLGLLTPAGLERDLPAAELASLAGAALAVSLEPAGGSPTGRPTGPVLYQGAIVPTS